MKVNVIYKKLTKTSLIEVLEEISPRGGEKWYIVKKYDINKFGNEILKEEVSFRNKIAAEKFAKTKGI